MAGQVEICNVALGLIGANTIITMTDAGSKPAKFCNLFWNRLARELLVEHDWRFARGRRSLNRVTAPDFGYEHAYRLPNDCLIVREVYEAGADTPTTSAWEVEGGELLADLAACNVIYTRDIVRQPGLFTVMFAQALEYRLAADLAIPLTSDGKRLQASMMNMYSLCLDKAETDDCRQWQPGPDTADSYLAARKD